MKKPFDLFAVTMLLVVVTVWPASGELVALVVFGGGLSWAATLIRI